MKKVELIKKIFGLNISVKIFFCFIIFFVLLSLILILFYKDEIICLINNKLYKNKIGIIFRFIFYSNLLFQILINSELLLRKIYKIQPNLIKSGKDKSKFNYYGTIYYYFLGITFLNIYIFIIIFYFNLLINILLKAVMLISLGFLIAIFFSIIIDDLKFELKNL